MEHVTIFSGDLITARRNKHVLEDAGIGVILKEDKIVGYEISSNSAELLVLENHEEEARRILNEL